MTRRFIVLALAIPAVAFSQGSKQKKGVFEYVVQSATVTFEAAATSIESTAAGAGWRVAGKVPSAMPEVCPYRSVVLVLVDSVYAREIMRANPKTGPFAISDRVNVFEDENGVHVAVVNPHSINRTVLMEDLKYESVTESHLQSLRAMIARAVPGTESRKQFGELRDQGYISKTMGVMAGGKFEDKIGDQAVVPASEWTAVVPNVRRGLATVGPKWGMHVVYEYELPEFQTVVFGTTGSPMDRKSFEIVKAGSDKTREAFKCAGLAHAAAYPVEVVVAQDGSAVRVRQVDAMFRMKMFFEDAGKWAFMKNMGMPGSIDQELKAQITSGLTSGK